MLKVAATEFLWYAANRVFQLAGGTAYMRDQPYEKILRDVRIFTIFEGANDVLRTFAAERGLTWLARTGRTTGATALASGAGRAGLASGAGRAGLASGAGRAGLASGAGLAGGLHPALADEEADVAERLERLGRASSALLERHGEGVAERQLALAALAEAGTGLAMQVATLSRLSSAIAGASLREAFVARTAATRGATRADAALTHLEAGAASPLPAIARDAAAQGGYPFDLHPAA
jgi:acyl-CoA dehydrogenase family protein 9